MKFPAILFTLTAFVALVSHATALPSITTVTTIENLLNITSAPLHPRDRFGDFVTCFNQPRDDLCTLSTLYWPQKAIAWVQDSSCNVIGFHGEQDWFRDFDIKTDRGDITTLQIRHDGRETRFMFQGIMFGTNQPKRMDETCATRGSMVVCDVLFKCRDVQGLLQDSRNRESW